MALDLESSAGLASPFEFTYYIVGPYEPYKPNEQDRHRGLVECIRAAEAREAKRKAQREAAQGNGAELRGFHFVVKKVELMTKWHTWSRVYRGKRVVITASLLDRVTQEPFELLFSWQQCTQSNDPDYPGKPQPLMSDARLIKRCMLFALQHELDECLYEGGDRRTEPHLPDGDVRYYDSL